MSTFTGECQQIPNTSVKDRIFHYIVVHSDLVVTHEPPRTVVMVDVTVPFENTFEALEKARLEKILKYHSLADSLRGRGYTVHVDGFVVGALGYAGLMRPLIVSETIAWSRDVYVEHVTEIRQYLVPAPGEQFEAPVACDDLGQDRCTNEGGCTDSAAA
ncbi:hypothetical protein WN51_07101 [Melipona quadrifasciata]|uniref:Uncharacterized protein n=1 Tax=Melipona quadrifasciata TaxID=166423 RepID=A0A0N0BCH5_9HYME|nr:hypothetical protein WN51_07101 [Melipona quadrifasciata]